VADVDVLAQEAKMLLGEKCRLKKALGLGLPSTNVEPGESMKSETKEDREEKTSKVSMNKLEEYQRVCAR
jgi:hypothetical protein